MIQITKDIKIGIIGLGMVGSQVKKWFILKNHQIFSYDKFLKIGSLKDIDKTEIIFFCLPTPYNKKEHKGVDISVFEQIIKFFKKPKIFIIKSTIPIGVTDFLQKKFKKHYFFHNPEFLTETTAWKDFSNPFFQLLGFTKKSKKIAKEILEILPSAKISKIIPASESELFKLARNAFFANKVIFANEIYELCKKMDIDYENFRVIMEEELKNGKERANHFKIFHKGYRGFGGKCLPKDLKILIKTFKSKKLKPELFEIIDKINNQLLKKQNLIKKLKSNWLNNIQ